MIDEKRIKQNLETFSFPRLSGTVAEKKAFEIAKKKIEDLNLVPIVQEFEFSTFYSRIYPKIGFSIGFWLLMILLLNVQGVFTLISLFITVIVFLPALIITRKPEKIKIGKKMLSQNLYTTILSNSGENIQKKDNNAQLYDNDRSIMLFSHLDSKGQRFSILTRVKFIKAWLYSFFTCLFIVILKNYVLIQYSSLFFLVCLFPLGINLIATIYNFLNSTNNKSPGSIDNASGIAILLELLNYFSDPRNRLKNHDLCFCFTGAEESGCLGIRHFVKELKHINKEESLAINFDAIGQSIALFVSRKSRKVKKQVYEFLTEKGKELNLLTDIRKKILGAHSDGYYLMTHGFRGVGFGDVKIYKHIHSINDTVDKVNVSLLKKLCDLLIVCLKEKDSRIKY